MPSIDRDRILLHALTRTYRAIKRVFESRQGVRPAHARLPELTLKSPKPPRDRTTAWFAESVDRRRFDVCLKRLR